MSTTLEPQLEAISEAFEGENKVASMFHSFFEKWRSNLVELDSIKGSSKLLLKEMKSHSIIVDAQKKKVIDDVEKFRSEIMLLAMEGDNDGDYHENEEDDDGEFEGDGDDEYENDADYAIASPEEYTDFPSNSSGAELPSATASSVVVNDGVSAKHSRNGKLIPSFQSIDHDNANNGEKERDVMHYLA